MALRADTVSSSGTSSGHNMLAGLTTFWEKPTTAPHMEWEKWWDLFSVATMAKYSIDTSELLRTPTAQRPRVEALLGSLSAAAAERKIVSVLFLALGTAARKSLVDRFPDMVVAAIALVRQSASIGVGWRVGD